MRIPLSLVSPKIASALFVMLIVSLKLSLLKLIPALDVAVGVDGVEILRIWLSHLWKEIVSGGTTPAALRCELWRRNQYICLQLLIYFLHGPVSIVLDYDRICNEFFGCDSIPDLLVHFLLFAILMSDDWADSNHLDSRFYFTAFFAAVVASGGMLAFGQSIPGGSAT